VRYNAINFKEKFGFFDEQWQPKVIAEMNDYQFKVVKLQGDFIWHDHRETDEAFIVMKGVRHACGYALANTGLSLLATELSAKRLDSSRSSAAQRPRGRARHAPSRRRCR